MSNRTVLLPVAVTIALVVLGAFAPTLPIWGLNHLSFYPMWLRIAGVSLLALALVPAVTTRLYAGLAWVARMMASTRTTRYATVFIVASACFILFMTARSRMYLLGDGQLVANTLSIAHEDGETYVKETLISVVKNERFAPGASVMYYLASVLYMMPREDREPVRAVSILNSILGALFVLVLVAAALRRDLNPVFRSWLLILTLGCGGMLLFFGYVEFYTPLFFFGALYVLAAHGAIHGIVPLWAPIVLVLLAAYAHVEGVLLLPSAAFLVTWRLWLHNSASRQNVATVVITSTIVVGAAAAVLLTPLKKHFLPILGGDYSVLSPMHWVDIANELFLLVPMAPLVIALAIGARRGHLKDAANGKRRTHTMFALNLLAPCILYLVVFNPEIGFNRDWDLFSVTAFGLIPVSLIVLERVFSAADNRAAAAMATGSAILVSIVLSASWIGINASPPRSTERFERLLEYDDRLPAYNYENLGRAYYQTGQLAQAVRAMERVCEVSPNPRTRYLMAIYYYEYGDSPSAEAMLRKILVQRPTFRDVRDDLIEILFFEGRYDEVIEQADAGLVHHPDYGRHYYYKGRSLARMGRLDAGEEILRRGLSVTDNEQARALFDRELKLIDRVRAQK